MRVQLARLAKRETGKSDLGESAWRSALGMRTAIGDGAKRLGLLINRGMTDRQG